MKKYGPIAITDTRMYVYASHGIYVYGSTVAWMYFIKKAHVRPDPVVMDGDVKAAMESFCVYMNSSSS